MPWKYIRPEDADAIAHREGTLGRVAQWWSEFTAHAPAVEARLRGEGDWDLDAWVGGHLRGIDPRIEWEFGTTADDAGAAAGHSLVITPGRHLAARPVVDSVLQSAPAVPGWSFAGHRPANPPEAVDEIVRAKTGQSWLGSLVQARIGAGHRIDLTWQTRAALKDEDAARAAAVAAGEALLGEDAVNRWVGVVDVVAPNPALRPTDFMLPQRLAVNVQALVASLLTTLPAVPYLKLLNRETKWETYRLDARPKGDYVGQEDMAIGNTMSPELRAAMTSGLPFYSTSFSRAGDTFCYLKIDLPGIHMDDRRRQRKAMESAIERPLRKSEVAGVVGSGTGLRYVYFDLAVMDLPTTLKIVETALRPLGLPDRSWLLFCDSELADEWIGLHPDAPPPPKAKVEQKAADSGASQPDAADAGDPLPPATYELDHLGFVP